MGVREERREFRRLLGLTLGRVRVKMTNYTQEGIGEALGLNSETVGRWERGDREPKVFELHRIAAKYKAPGDWFLNPSDSVTEVDRRIAEELIARERRAAAAAAQETAEEEQRQRAGGDGATRRGRGRA